MSACLCDWIFVLGPSGTHRHLFQLPSSHPRRAHKHTFCCRSYYKTPQLGIVAVRRSDTRLHKRNLICLFRGRLLSAWRLLNGEEVLERVRDLTEKEREREWENASNATNGISISFNLLESLRSALSCNVPLPRLTWSVSFMLQMLFASVIQSVPDNPRLHQPSRTAPDNENTGSAEESFFVVVHFPPSRRFVCAYCFEERKWKMCCRHDKGTRLEGNKRQELLSLSGRVFYSLSYFYFWRAAFIHSHSRLLVQWPFWSTFPLPCMCLVPIWSLHCSLLWYKYSILYFLHYCMLLSLFTSMLVSF